MIKWLISALLMIALSGCVDSREKEIRQLWDNLEGKLVQVGKAMDVELDNIFERERIENQFRRTFPKGTTKLEIEERLKKATRIEGVMIYEEELDEPGHTLLSILMSVDHGSLTYFVSFSINNQNELIDVGSGFGGIGTVGDYKKK